MLPFVTGWTFALSSAIWAIAAFVGCAEGGWTRTVLKSLRQTFESTCMFIGSPPALAFAQVFTGGRSKAIEKPVYETMGLNPW